ncbi:MAG: DUF47 family protein [Elusimicrobiota bacterium]|jgi:hypothetical protein
MWFRKRFNFYQMLLDQARMSEQGLGLLVAFVQNPTQELGERVEAAEKNADDLRRALIEALNRTFVTPLDREDIFALSRAIDDMVDYAKSTVEEMLLFQTPTNQHLKDMADALYEGGRHIAQAVSKLPHIPNGIEESIILAKKTENQMEHLYRKALAELFKDPDLRKILKMREIYRHLSNAADRADEAANIISDILMKNT